MRFIYTPLHPRFGVHLLVSLLYVYWYTCYTFVTNLYFISVDLFSVHLFVHFTYLYRLLVCIWLYTISLLVSLLILYTRPTIKMPYNKSKTIRKKNQQRYRNKKQEIWLAKKSPYKANSEKHKKLCKQYYVINCEKTKEASKLAYQANPEKAKEASKLAYQANPEKAKEASKLAYQTNPEKAQEASKLAYQTNPEKAKEASKLAYLTNPEKAKESSKSSYKANPEKGKVASKQRYSKQKIEICKSRKDKYLLKPPKNILLREYVNSLTKKLLANPEHKLYLTMQFYKQFSVYAATLPRNQKVKVAC